MSGRVQFLSGPVQGDCPVGCPGKLVRAWLKRKSCKPYFPNSSKLGWKLSCFPSPPDRNGASGRSHVLAACWTLAAGDKVAALFVRASADVRNRAHGELVAAVRARVLAAVGRARFDCCHSRRRPLLASWGQQLRILCDKLTKCLSRNTI